MTGNENSKTCLPTGRFKNLTRRANKVKYLKKKEKISLNVKV
jgi:hypothetical protein